ncbi:MAG TPA: 2-C-methyl-D-erythritol 4-phosphate cytidylyltransferase [Jatrophihabitans sp.]|nr:2-C-methyl-D-erythritol 4-phosphate cytidylyltransferase [Jatrophihabitans sp.]
MTTAAVILAAGSGSRLGADVPKALVSLGNKTILDWSVGTFADHPGIDALVVVGPPAATAAIAATLPAGAQVVPGGATRQESVGRGLAALGDEVEFVLVQDAARPLVPALVISRVLDELAAGAEAVVPVLPVTDTIRQLDDGGQVIATPERSRLRRVQTPQGFRLEILRSAHAAAAERGATGEVTDDAGLVEALGHRVRTVPGADAGFKITSRQDLRLAELLVSS